MVSTLLRDWMRRRMLRRLQKRLNLDKRQMDALIPVLRKLRLPAYTGHRGSLRELEAILKSEVLIDKPLNARIIQRLSRYRMKLDEQSLALVGFADETEFQLQDNRKVL